ncbi:hypothetical protein DSO57_1020613 [Entomophthora muscae]|uniref:Uncharacterized protein n=1 Tax=Entomophthora muscae TaxID=34485 RepID=A0ACC2RI97_9FUNG|nr:hypothetical protein DSO57_1020613 [Entomophthora muscae]
MKKFIFGILVCARGESSEQEAAHKIPESSREFYSERVIPRPENKYETSAPGTSYGPPIFEDNFDFFDHDKWRHEMTLGGGGNWEFQFYHNNRSSSFVSEGKLHLKPVLTSDYLGVSDDQLMKSAAIDLWGNSPGFQCTANGFYGCSRSSDGNNIVNPVMSAQLRTHHSFSFRYGKVEMRAKLPRGDWLWPAMWLLPVNYAYGGWPASGEIDLLESRGNTPGYHGNGVDTVASTLHWGPDWQHNKYNLTTASYTLPPGETFADDFHTFTLEWTPKFIRTWVDNKHLMLDLDLSKRSMWDYGGFKETGLFNPWRDAAPAAPFDQKFYLILNLAVGGGQTSTSPRTPLPTSPPAEPGWRPSPSPGRTAPPPPPRTS